MSEPGPVPMRETPVPGYGTIHDAVAADLREREREGNAEYGSAHGLFNGYDGLAEAYEEALDQACWLRQEIEERKITAAGGTVPVAVLEALASAWEDQAAALYRTTDLDGPHALNDCARMLREAIAHGGAG